MGSLCQAIDQRPLCVYRQITAVLKTKENATQITANNTDTVSK